MAHRLFLDFLKVWALFGFQIYQTNLNNITCQLSFSYYALDIYLDFPRSGVCIFVLNMLMGPKFDEEDRIL